jgi:eukaryotic-like serine/threonine-protein kinase
MLSSGTILQGRYRIVRQLGQGGMGAVYEAVDQRLDTIVALKETLFAEEKLRKQFEREARLLARLHHQALPRVSDHFNESDGQFLVMQYVAGDDLFEMLAKRKGPFPQEEVLGWADQLCDALDYLHTQDPQIIHRDIKPQNLKLTSRGQIVLLDFGLAKGSAGQMSVVTTSASIYGYTPNYAPLEQVQGLGTDPRSDIYSLAATLYHMLTNVKPPDALSRAAAIVNGQDDPLQPAHIVGAQVTAAVASVLNCGMSQKRNDRYPSAAAMRIALRAAAQSQEALAEAETVLAAGALAHPDRKTIASEQRTRLIGEEKTVAAASEARTLVANDAKTLNAAAPTIGETVTVVHQARSGRGVRVWLAAAALIVLLVGVAGAFYAYRLRRNAATQDQSTSAQPGSTQPDDKATNSLPVASPVESPVQSVTLKSTESKSEKRTVAETTQRTDSTKQPAGTIPEPPKPPTGETAHDVDRNRGRNQNTEPPPRQDQPGNQGNANTRRNEWGQVPSVRTFPNGRRVVTQPDGTRIVTFPDGSTRIIPPATRPNQRRRYPN